MNTKYAINLYNNLKYYAGIKTKYKVNGENQGKKNKLLLLYSFLFCFEKEEFFGVDYNMANIS